MLSEKQVFEHNLPFGITIYLYPEARYLRSISFFKSFASTFDSITSSFSRISFTSSFIIKMENDKMVMKIRRPMAKSKEIKHFII